MTGKQILFNELTNEVHIELNEGFPIEIILNKELQLHVTYDEVEGTYLVDYYNYSMLEEPFENDFIESNSISVDKELTRSITVELDVTDGSDETYSSDSWSLTGSKLYHDRELKLDSILLTDDIVQRILDYEHDTVAKITLEDETIYEY